MRRAVAVDGRAADVGIATTGIASPDSPDGQPVGTVHIVVTPRPSQIPHLFTVPAPRSSAGRGRTAPRRCGSRE
ncbi:CinA family protein [Microbacterium sp.]|uniref:CinA family protein n=1 Tax=Microbacterium sp. TaxID=51671 RepID=UPI003A8F2989